MNKILKSILVYLGVFTFLGLLMILVGSFVEAEWHFDIMSWSPETRGLWLLVNVLVTGGLVDAYKTMKGD